MQGMNQYLGVVITSVTDQSQPKTTADNNAYIIIDG